MNDFFFFIFFSFFFLLSYFFFLSLFNFQKKKNPQKKSKNSPSYADVVVHRLLAAAIGVDPPPPGASPEALASPKPEAAHEAVAENLNARHRGAQLAARASVELHTILFFRARQKRMGKGGGGGGDGDDDDDGTTVADARVVGVRANGVVVFVPKFGIEGPAFFETFGDDSSSPSTKNSSSSKEWTLSADGCSATDPLSGRVVSVFDVVAVRISVKGGGGGDDGGGKGGGSGRERLVLELVDRSLLAPEDVATA